MDKVLAYSYEEPYDTYITEGPAIMNAKPIDKVLHGQTEKTWPDIPLGKLMLKTGVMVRGSDMGYKPLVFFR